LSEGRLERIEATLTRMPDLRVLVVGDLLLDEYRRGEVERISPEAPVPILRVRESSTLLGGAANVARAIVSLGAKCRLVGLVGDDVEGEALLSHVEALGMATGGILRVRDRPTAHKLRVVARGQQMMRLDREDDSAISRDLSAQLREVISREIEDCNLVILEDYDKGIFGEGLARWVIEFARSRGVSVVADPKRDLARFRGASLVKPNLDEATRFVSGSGSDFDARRSLMEKLRFELGGGEVVVTRGRAGMSALDEEGRAFDVPTRPLEVFDVQGAGDTSIAALGLCRAAGSRLADACIVANAAAAVAVEKTGTAAVGRSELRRRLPEMVALCEGEK
jgi:rfaE bifunctional protein kinase chain/domain